MKVLLVLALALLFTNPCVFAALPIHRNPSDTANLELPVVDTPFNFIGGGLNFPSMRQSLALSSSFYEVSHRAILGERENREWWKYLVVGGFDAFTGYLPLGNAWLHEEWHRSVMSRRNIHSYNDVYNLPIGQNIIAVSHVNDIDLVNLKANHPAEQVRLSSAGMESQVAQNLYIQKNQFFRESAANNIVLFWMNNLSVSGYLSLCGSSSADASTSEQNSEDGVNIQKRDFTGLDCTAWVYDLFRPDEPYGLRGGHPSGVGIDRYITYSDLTEREKDFLAKQTTLSYLNFFDPFLFGIDSLHSELIGESFDWNAKLSHALTSFGYVVNMHFFLRTEFQKFLFEVHHGFSPSGYFPGATFAWEEARLSDKWDLTPSLTLWNQPAQQRFDHKNASAMVSGGLRFAYKFLPSWKSYLSLLAKTDGWQTGEDSIDRSLSITAGIQGSVF
ncbi:MAG: hypothetical protein KDD22_05985 [Bdellovibrionales bacterium]|nr:hypothetical protein [Bdellovibrionales bacterium]